MFLICIKNMLKINRERGKIEQNSVWGINEIICPRPLPPPPQDPLVLSKQIEICLQHMKWMTN